MAKDLLLVDLGNSSIKWAFASGDEVVAASGTAHQGKDIKHILNAVWGDFGAPTCLWLCSVAPSTIKEELISWISTNWHITPKVMASSAFDCGLYNGYQLPSSLGVDRWAALIAAHRRYPHGCCVLDCGTAITLDATLGNHHLGGYILPGFDLMEKALRNNTAIAKPDGSNSSAWLGTDTGTAIWLGSHRAVAALVEQSLETLQAQGCCDPGLILTGSACHEVSSLIEVSHDTVEHLVLDGLLAYAGEKDC